jgi:alpha-ribazole phosphatase
MLIDLLRHGETDLRDRFCGSTEADLTPNGLQQMWDAVAGLVPSDRVITSPMRRCSTFAQALAEHWHRPLLTLSDLREIHFGTWEGRLVNEVAVEQALALSHFWSDPEHHAPPCAESLTDFGARVLTAMRLLYTERPTQHLLLITHGGVLRYLLCLARGLPLTELLSLSVPHAILCRLTVDRRNDGHLIFTEVSN